MNKYICRVFLGLCFILLSNFSKAQNCTELQEFTESSGTFEDGSGPGNRYGNNLNCQYSIRPESGGPIRISFNYFSLSRISVSDRLNIIGITNSETIPLISLNNLGISNNLIVNQDEVLVEFITDNFDNSFRSTNGFGWELNYESNFQNRPPDFANETFQISENSGIGAIITQFDRVDEENDPVTYSIVSGNDENLFSLSNRFGRNAELTLNNASLDFELTPTYTLIIEATDQIDTVRSEITINVEDVDESLFPVVPTQSISIFENLPSGTNIGQLIAENPAGGNLIFREINDPFGSISLRINEQGEVFIDSNRPLLDFEDNSEIQLDFSVSNNLGTTLGSLTIQLEDIGCQSETRLTNNIGEFTDGSGEANYENNSDCTWLIAPESGGPIRFTVDELDLESNDFIRLTNFRGDEQFAFISSFGQEGISYLINSDTVLVEFITDISNTNDGWRLSYEGNVENSVPEVADQIIQINEGNIAQRIIGNVNAVDADNDELTYRIISGNEASFFNLNSVTGELSTANLIISLTAGMEFPLIIGISDGIVESMTTMTISAVTNEASSLPILENQTFSIPENSPNGTFVGQIIAENLAGGNLTFRNSRFNNTINISLDGEISVNSSFSLNFERNPSLTFDVIATNEFGSTTGIITIEIIDVTCTGETVLVSDSGTFGDGSMEAISEERSECSWLIQPISGGPIKIQLNEFEIGFSDRLEIINAETGAIISEVSNRQSRIFTEADSVRIIYSTGSSPRQGWEISYEAGFENESPVILPQIINIAEIAQEGIFGKVVATDPENSPLTFTINSGNEEGLFSVNGLTGEISLTSNNILDFETRSSYALNVEVFDGLRTASAEITINLIDADESQLPMLVQSIFNVPENLARRALIVRLEATSIGNQQVTFSSPDGFDRIVDISGNGEITVRDRSLFNFEQNEILTFDVLVSNFFGTVRETITLNLLDLGCTNQEVLVENSGTFSDRNMGTIPESRQNCTWLLRPAGGGPIRLTLDSISNFFSSEIRVFDNLDNRLVATFGNFNSQDILAIDSDEVRVEYNTGFASSPETWQISYESGFVNSVPLIVDQTFFISQNQTTRNVGEIIAIDADNDALFFEITAGNEDNIFSIDRLTGRLSIDRLFDLNPDLVSSYSLNIEISDGIDLVNQIFEINLIEDDPGFLPIVNNTVFTVSENLPRFYLIGNVEATNPTSGDLFYNITNFNRNFSIDNEGEISFNGDGVLDFEQNESVTFDIQVSNNIGTIQETITVNLLDIGCVSQPNLTANSGIIEDGSGGAYVELEESNCTWVIAPEAGGPIRLELLNFDVDGNDRLLITNLRDNRVTSLRGDQGNFLVNGDSISIEFENNRSFRRNQGWEIAYTGGATNDLLIVENQEFSIPESRFRSFTNIGRVIATDNDNDRLSYSIVSGNEENLFFINPTTGNISLESNFTFDFESVPSYHLTVSVTDQVDTIMAEIAINVIDLDEALFPRIEDQTFVTSENLRSNFRIGTIIAENPIAGSIEFNLVERVNGLFIGRNGEIMASESPPLDFEANNPVIFDVEVRNSFGTSVATITLNLLDVGCNDMTVLTEESGTFDDGSGVAFYEAGSNCTWLVQPENGGPIELSLDQIDLGFDDELVITNEDTGELIARFDRFDRTGRSFRIDANAVRISFNTAELDPFFTRQGNGWQISYTSGFSNNAPIINDQVFSINETATNGTFGIVVAEDPEGDEITYSISSGNEQGLFFITRDGELRLTSVFGLDFESNPAYDLTVSASDQLDIASAIVTVNVLDIDETRFPQIETVSFTSIENLPNGSIIGTLEVTNPAGGQLTFATESFFAPFSIDNQGVVSLNNRLLLDFETNPVVDLNVSVTNQVGTTNGVISINLVDIGCSDQTVLTDNSGILTDGSLEGFYEPNSNCSWLIEPVNGESIRLSINELEISRGDTLRITNNLTQELVAEYTWTTRTENYLIPSSSVLVEFTADDDIEEAQGWEIAYETEFINNAPTISEQEFILSELTTLRSIGFVEFNDLDEDLLSLSIISGDTDDFFVLNEGTGELLLANHAQLDFETNPTYEMIVQVDDGIESSEAVVTITLVDEDESMTPIVANQSFDVLENLPINTILGKIDFINPIDNGIVNIRELNPNPNFSINNQGEILVTNPTVLDFERNESIDYNIVIENEFGAVGALMTFNLIDIGCSEGNILTEASGVISDGSLEGNYENNSACSWLIQPSDGGPIRLNVLALDLAVGDTVFIYNGADNSGSLVASLINANIPEDNILIDAEAAYIEFKTDFRFSAGGWEISYERVVDNTLPPLNDFTLNLIESTATGRLLSFDNIVDDEGDELEYELIGGNESGLFSIEGNFLNLESPFNFDLMPTHELRLRLSDPFDSLEFLVNINVLRESEVASPVILDQTFTINENLFLGTIIGELEATDPNGLILSYSLENDEISPFSLLNGGTLIASGFFDFENFPSFEFNVIASNGVASDTATVTLNILDLGCNSTEPTVFTAPSGTFDDGSGESSVEINSRCTWIIEPENAESIELNFDFLEFRNANDLLVVREGNDPRGRVIITLDRNSFNPERLNINASAVYISFETGGFAFSQGQGFQITYKSFGEPEFVDQSFIVNQGDSNGTVIGNLEAIDSFNNELVYTIVNGNIGNVFSVDELGRLILRDSSALNFDITPTYSLLVRASNNLFETSAEVIVQLNTVPVLENQVIEIIEGTSNESVVGTIQANDQDDDVLMYNIVDGNISNAFMINNVDGTISVNNAEALDFDINPTFNLLVEVSDGKTTAIGTVDISLSTIPEIENQVFTILEGSVIGTEVGTVLANDRDGDVLSYVITEGNTDDAFIIDTESGLLSVNNSEALAFNVNPSFTLEITVSDGNLATNGSVNISLSTVPEIADQSFVLLEGSDNGTEIGNVLANDRDGDVLSYVITAGNTDDAFIIDAESGLLSVNNSEALAFNVNPSFTLEITVSDGNLATNGFVNITLNTIPEVEDQSFALLEGSDNGTEVGNILANDRDGDVLTFVIIEGNTDDAFVIDEESGMISVNNSVALDFDTNPVFNLSVEVTDGIETAVANVTIELNAITSIVNQLQIDEISIYPNPISNRLNVSLNVNQLMKVEINIIDLNGKRVLHLFEDEILGGFEQQFEIDLTDGVYLIQFNSESQVVNKRIIVRK